MVYNTLALFQLAGIAAAGVLPRSAGTAVGITPHDSYSSSAGVLGCKVDVNRMAYWPYPVDCNNLCVKVTHASGRFVHLLRMDKSGGAHDISYDAWNYLYTGQSAKVNPKQDGVIPATYEDVPMTDPACLAILSKAGGKLPLTAANAMNFYASCAPGTWARDNAAFFNIYNTQCTLGIDEPCIPPVLELGENQPKCPGGPGVFSMAVLTTAPVMNIVYGTGVEKVAV